MSNFENEPVITITKTAKQSDATMYILLGAVLVVVLGFSFVAITLGGGAKHPRPKVDYPPQDLVYKESNGANNSTVKPEIYDTVTDRATVNTNVTPTAEKKPAVPAQRSPVVESMSAVPCSDTDGGKFPYTYGEITGVQRLIVADADGTRRYVDGELYTYRDVCGGGGTMLYQGETVQTQVAEFFCGDDGRVTQEGVKCPLGCKGGVCIAENIKPTVWLRADGQDEMVRKEYGATVTLTWGSAMAETCSISSNGTATETWNAGTIPLSGTKKLIVNNTTTSTYFTISCTSSTGYTTKDEVRVYSQSKV